MLVSGLLVTLPPLGRGGDICRLSPLAAPAQQNAHGAALTCVIHAITRPQIHSQLKYAGGQWFGSPKITRFQAAEVFVHTVGGHIVQSVEPFRIGRPPVFDVFLNFKSSIQTVSFMLPLSTQRLTHKPAGCKYVTFFGTKMMPMTWCMQAVN